MSDDTVVLDDLDLAAHHVRKAEKATKAALLAHVERGHLAPAVAEDVAGLFGDYFGRISALLALYASDFHARDRDPIPVDPDDDQR